LPRRSGRLPSPCWCSPGGGLGTSTSRSAGDCQRTAAIYQYAAQIPTTSCKQRVAATRAPPQALGMSARSRDLLADRGDSADPDRNRDVALIRVADSRYSAVAESGADPKHDRKLRQRVQRSTALKRVSRRPRHDDMTDAMAQTRWRSMPSMLFADQELSAPRSNQAPNVQSAAPARHRYRSIRPMPG